MEKRDPYGEHKNNRGSEQERQCRKSATVSNLGAGLAMSGSRVVRPEVLAAYAVKAITGPDNGQEVASMGDSQEALQGKLKYAL